MEMLAFMDATPTSEGVSAVAAQLSNRSWLTITEPCTGMLLLALPVELISSIGSAVLGRVPEPGSSEFTDRQGELANIIAGRFVFELMGPNARIGLGLPQTGAGAPEVRSPGWVAQEFRINGHPFAAYVHGEGFLRDAPPAASPLKISSLAVTMNGFPAVAGSHPCDLGMPETLAGYRIITRLGDSGTGVVYRAIHATLSREVALRVMDPVLAQDPSFVSQFLAEARTAVRIEHPHVVPVHEAGVHEGLLYLAMGYVCGGSLAQVIAQKGPMPQTEALAACAHCLDGLQAIDACGLIHGAITPGNVLLDGDGAPYLADLGWSRAGERCAGSGQAVRSCASAAYMAPEQAKQGASVDIRSDIYSLGATLYAMLAGVPPFQGDSVQHTIAQVIKDHPTSIRSHLVDVDPRVEALIMMALEKDPNLRPQTPREFLGFIHGIQAATEHAAPPEVPCTLPGSTAEPVDATALRAVTAGANGEHWLSRWLRGRSNG